MSPVRALSFRLPPPVLVAYAAGALFLSLALLQTVTRRGGLEPALWLGAYVAVAGFSLRRPDLGPLAAGFAAFLLGFTRTFRPGVNLDLGLSLILLSVGVSLLVRARREGGAAEADPASMLLLATATWSVLSLGFSLARIHSFSPVPGFSYHVYRFNLVGLGSDEALVRALAGAAASYCWFGLYESGRRLRVGRGPLAIAILAALLANGLALFAQRWLDPSFLHPIGFPLIGRLNGLTSFCYALGDVLLALFLLLPAWGARRGRLGAVTAAALLLVVHAVLASGSRTALFGIVLTATLWIGMRGLLLLRAGRRAAAALAAGGTLVVVTGLLCAYRLAAADQATPLGRLKDAVQREGLFGHLYSTRLSSYPLLFRVLAKYPLTGVGAGLYPLEVDKQRALLAPDLRTDPYLLNSYAPNQFLNTGVELGMPAMLALAGVMAYAWWRALARREEADAGYLAVSVVALAGALQLGPGLCNSEALVFDWLVIGLAARTGRPRGPAGQEDDPGTAGARTTTAWLLGALLLGLAGQVLAWPSLSLDRQWARLRWRMHIGMQPPQADGQWTGSEATFTVAADTPGLLVRWHAGDAGAPRYRCDVSFYVDGRLVERAVAVPGRVRESVLPLPPVRGLKRISVRVLPPFVPAREIGGHDDRQLGIFLHAVRPLPPVAASGGPATRPAS